MKDQQFFSFNLMNNILYITMNDLFVMSVFYDKEAKIKKYKKILIKNNKQ